MQFNSIQSHYLTQKNTNQETQNSAPELFITFLNQRRTCIFTFSQHIFCFMTN